MAKVNKMTINQHINIDLTRNVKAIQKKLAQWQAMRQFRSMDTQSLQDIGIERYQIRDFVLNGQ